MRSALARFARNRLALLGAAVLLGLLALVALTPLLFPDDPFRLVGPALQPPGGRFLLGTDTLGRDVAAEIAYGARTSLMIGLGATLAAILFGTLVGGLAGYYRGGVEIALMRLTEFFQTIPAFVLAILIVAILSPSLTSEIVAIAAVSWPGIARLVRGEFVALGGREFVLACDGLGAGDARIIFRHMLPNCASAIIAVGSLLIGTAILIEAGLAFLGLGDPNVMSWGLIISAGRAVLRSAWWICTFPGIAILLTVLGINLVGDGLNEAMNPRLRER
ncbi:ABC transporter permease [Methylobacterium sp. GXS13]|jgi:peptide/nickel transport system permease protein|uniref:ABC transporter permease n=1 Tax=Methylobacterium sp. GXS13 TaxID=1730094 RepID=UPI00071BB4D4|nr:ABC transporter permease [Methylobacterium sp. GXS13]KST59407.1 ABC transporter permease [Methylobacterium sp. GXS13]